MLEQAEVAQAQDESQKLGTVDPRPGWPRLQPMRRPARRMIGNPADNERDKMKSLLMVTTCFYVMNPAPPQMTPEEMAILQNPETRHAYAMQKGLAKDVVRTVKTHPDGTPCIDEDCVCTESAIGPVTDKALQ